MKLAVMVLVGAVGWLLLLVGLDRSIKQQTRSYQPKNRVNNASTPDHSTPPSTPERPLKTTPATTLSDQNPYDDEHQHRTQGRQWGRSEVLSAISAAATLAGSVITAGALIAAIQAVNEARRQADTAQQALVAADRPWIKVVGLSNVHLRIDESAVVLSAMVDLKNIGRSPAPQTYVATKLIRHGNIIDGTKEAYSFCEEAHKRYFPITDVLIFPDDQRSFSNAYIASVKHIRMLNEENGKRDFEHNVQIFGQEKAEEFEKGLAPGRRFSSFTLIGCVTYMIPSALSIGETTFAYNIYRSCGADSRKSCLFDLTVPENFEKDRVIVRDTVYGNFAR